MHHKRVYRLDFEYPEVQFVYHYPYATKVYRPGEASWNRLRRWVNQQIESSGLEFGDIGKAMLFL